MPFYPRKKKTARPRVRRNRRAVRIARMPRYQSQFFTETFKCNTTGASPTSTGVNTNGEILVPMPAQTLGGKFAFKMTDLPQYNSYADLYQQYKVTKVQAIIIPKWSANDPNQAAANNGAAPGTVPSYERARIAYAINDDVNDLHAPTTELEVLEDNGCKIRAIDRSPIKITFRPKPAIGMTDPTTNNLVPTQPKYRDWLGFGDKGVPADAPVHIGVDWFISAASTAGVGFLSVADVYFKVTFCCKDPR